MSFVPYCFRPPCLPPTRSRLSPQRLRSLTSCQPRLSTSPWCTLLSWENLRLTNIFEFLAASVIQTSPLLLPINSLPALPCVSFLAIPLTTKDIAALISLQIESSSPGMSSLMNLSFLSLSVTALDRLQTLSFWMLLTFCPFLLDRRTKFFL